MAARHHQVMTGGGARGGHMSLASLLRLPHTDDFFFWANPETGNRFSGCKFQDTEPGIGWPHVTLFMSSGGVGSRSSTTFIIFGKA